MPQSKLLIGTPAYNSQVHTDYLHSIIAFQRAGIQFTVMTIGNESLITRARNTIISKFAALDSFTHLLFLDGDVYLGAEDLQRMIDAGEDLLAAPVPLKYRDDDGNRRFNLGKLLGQKGQLAVVDHVGTAVMLMSSRLVKALVAQAESAGHSYRINPLSTNDTDPGRQYDVFRVGVEDDNYLSEDFWVCNRARELGFEVLVDTSVTVRHSGMGSF